MLEKCLRFYIKAAMKLELPLWYDLHAHFRQDGIMSALVQNHLKMGCAGILAMPNTKPPVAKVRKKDPADCWSIEEYRDQLMKAGADKFQTVITPLYLTQNTTPKMIEEGAKAGILQAAKYYPPHGTTGAEFGAPFQTYIDNGVFKAMEEAGVVLNIHGEEHALESSRYFDRESTAEEIFYRERLPRAVQKFPKLKIVCEHVTTKVAVDFVSSAPANIAATITPQHLLYTVGDLLKGLRYHLFCLPLLKFERDRQALRMAATSPANTKFFAGTDSAPHTKKVTECGCAAGCYTGGIAPQLYAQAFEEAGADLASKQGAEAFRRFLCVNGQVFYGLPAPVEHFTLEKAESEVTRLETPVGPVTPLPLGLAAEGAQKATLRWRILA